jgi:hypothetical protein
MNTLIVAVMVILIFCPCCGLLWTIMQQRRRR